MQLTVRHRLIPILLLFTGLVRTQTAPRRPRGIYAVVDVDTAIRREQSANHSITQADLHAYFTALYDRLLDNPAASGLLILIPWNRLNPNPPAGSQPYDWSYLDDGFSSTAAWNTRNPDKTPKTIQVGLLAGYFTPPWVLDQIPSCDGLFQSPPHPPPNNCGKATFVGFAEPHGDLDILPMPWNALYKTSFKTFLTAVSARYGSNPAWVSTGVAGPTAATNEMILPTDSRTPPQGQFGGISANDMWLRLLAFAYPNQPSYQKSDQAFIDEWNAAIDMFGEIFKSVTLVATTGAGLPNLATSGFTVPSAFRDDCGTPPDMDCAAEMTILAHFVEPSVASADAKATQESGLNGRAGLVASGVKRRAQVTAQLTSPSAQILGGLQFGTSFSNSPVQEGCTAKFPPEPKNAPTGCQIPATCTVDACVPVACIPQACLAPGVTQADLAGYKQFSNVPDKYLISPEQAAYNVLKNFFDGTPAASSFSGTPGSAPLNYLQIYAGDFEYAASSANTRAQVVQTGAPALSVSAQDLLNLASLKLLAAAEPAPAISLVANAEGESPTIAPNTWVEIKGSNLAPAGDTRIWAEPDFVGGKMPTALDGVSVTVNGKSAYVYYISPTQVNILTPPDSIVSTVQVIVTNNGSSSGPYTAQAQPLSPSFFVFNGGPYVAATHADGSLLGPSNLYPGLTTPAKPGEIVVLYGNGFGPTSNPVVSGSRMQSGSLVPPPVITIAGAPATVLFAGLVAPGQFQFNVAIPPGASGGDNTLVATYGGKSASGVEITIEGPPPPANSATFFVATNGNDSWTGTLASPNASSTDGPFATFDRARAAVQSLNKADLTQVNVQFRTGTYFLPATVQFTAADSGTPALQVVYANYPGESAVISGGARIQNWTSAGGNVWKTTLPASTKYFEDLYYNGVRRLRPRLGGYLGAYYRIVGPVFMNAPGPPAPPPNANCDLYVTGSGWECHDRFRYNPVDPMANTWKNLAPSPANPCGQPAGNAALAGDIELVDFEKYSVSKLRISCVDTTNHIVYLTGRTAAVAAANAPAHGFLANHRYLVENVQDQLTQPGQWFLDRSTTPWTLTYLAQAGENPNTDTVIVPQVNQLLVASSLQFVTFRGLAFEHDNYTIPAEGYTDPDTPVTPAVSFQNSQHITFDSGIVAHTSGAALEFISCINAQSPSWCVSRSTSAITTGNTVQNSAFYDLGANAVRIGMPGRSGDTASNIPQFTTVENNVVAGYGRLFPAAKGILQGNGHDNLYTHNDVYDGYHGAIAVCFCSGLTPLTSNNVISFNHVYNLFQGIENDGGSIYFATTGGGASASPAGNKMLNNKVHDVSDASVQDDDGYGGDGLYIDDFTGSVDVENNLVYRVSGNAVSFSGPRPGQNQGSTIKNNILAFARRSLINAYDPYSYDTAPPAPIFFVASNNLFYFDRNSASSPVFYPQGGCTYTGGIPYTAFEQWSSNIYWRTDGSFARDNQAFHVQPSAAAGPCTANTAKWIFYTLTGWQNIGEDVQSVIQDPGFKNPAFPADDYSLPKGSPGGGFLFFDPRQAGRTNPLINPPSVPSTFPTKTFNPATDF